MESSDDTAHAPKDFAVHFGDSAEQIKEMPDASVDLLLTDPPYNVGPASIGNIHFPNRTSYNLEIADWDHEPFVPADWIDEFRRVLKPKGNAFIFTGHNLFGQWHAAADPVFDTCTFAVWHKINPPPRIRYTGFLSSIELIVCLWNKGHTWNWISQNEMHNHFETPICMGNERLSDPKHPTQKPVALLERLVRIASMEGDTVYDPFMGVGSTGVAALNLDRRFVGVELDEEYYTAAKHRLTEAATPPPYQQVELFR